MKKVLQKTLLGVIKNANEKALVFFFAVCFRESNKGFFFTKLFTYFFQLEPGKIVVWARVFAWLLVKKINVKRILLGVVKNANQNLVVLFFQYNLVLCFVKCQG